MLLVVWGKWNPPKCFRKEGGSAKTNLFTNLSVSLNCISRDHHWVLHLVYVKHTDHAALVWCSNWTGGGCLCPLARVHTNAYLISGHCRSWFYFSMQTTNCCNTNRFIIIIIIMFTSHSVLTRVTRIFMIHKRCYTFWVTRITWSLFLVFRIILLHSFAPVTSFIKAVTGSQAIFYTS